MAPRRNRTVTFAALPDREDSVQSSDRDDSSQNVSPPASSSVPAGTQGAAPMDEALNQLIRAIREAGAASLPTGTHVEYTLEMPEPDSEPSFAGAGRVLGRESGPMYSSRTRSQESARNRSDSSTRANRGSASGPSSGSGPGSGSGPSPHDLRPRINPSVAVEASGGPREWDGEDFEIVNESPTQTRHIALVLSDNIDNDGTRRVNLQLPKVSYPVTLLLPQEEATAEETQGGESAFATSSRLFESQTDVEDYIANEIDFDESFFDDSFLDDEDAYNQLNALYEEMSDDSSDNTAYSRLQNELENALARRTTRLLQAIAYLSSRNVLADPQWHSRFASIEEYAAVLQGVEWNDGKVESIDVDADDGPSKALAEAEAALAAIEGSSSDDFSSPPVTLDDHTQQLLDKLNELLDHHRNFSMRDRSHTEVPARILASADDLQPLSADTNQSQIEAPSLAELLRTSGRSFAAHTVLQTTLANDVRSGGDRELGHVQDGEEGSLDGSKWEELETHPYTVQMGRYRRFRQHWMQQAREVAEAQYSNRSGWVTLPPFEGAYGLGNLGDDTGPLPVSMENNRRLLVLLRGIGRLLLRRSDIAPRPLLDEVLQNVERGLRGEGPGASLRLRKRYDIDGGTGDTRRTRRVNETEARWLQFLLSDSTNEQLSQPLPRGPHLDEDKSVDPDNADDVQNKAEEEGSRAMYHTFAHRFQALLDDPGRTVFRTADTQVPVTVLMMAINGVPTDPETKPETTERTQFCLYDTLHFLARLSRAGRCQFVHLPFEKSHGIVQRPVLDVHPEHRIHPAWARRSSSASASGDAEDSEDIAVGAPRRSIDVDANWAETLASGRASEDVPLSEDVRNFFNVLAFRFGHTLRELELVERPKWEANSRRQGRVNRSSAMQRSIRIWHNTYHALLHQSGALQEAQYEGIPTSFSDVIRLADPDEYSELGALTETEARQIVSSHLVDEAASGQQTPLSGWPGTAASGSTVSIWDWAHPSIVGEAPQFFHMDRWPLHLQTPETAAQVVDGARVALDPELVWDPASEDPASPEYLWLFSGPGYGYQRTTRIHPEFHQGESALQRQVLIRDLTRKVANEIGLDLDAEREEMENKKRGVLGWLGSKLPFGQKRKRSAADDGEEVDENGQRVRVIEFERTELPEVKDYPMSIDWMALVRDRVDAIEAEEAEGDDESMDVDGAEV